MTKQIQTVLLVDDDEVTNLIHTRVIEKSESVANIVVATDGKAALNILEQLAGDGAPLPELIFLDINMPRMGGFEFLEEYEARGMGDSGPMIIVMLSTSLIETDHNRAAADPNVHSFSNKMLRAELFLDLVDQYLARQQEPPLASTANA